MKHCTSKSRCRRLECATCTWRYSGQVTQRIELLNRGSGLHVIEVGGYMNFPLWRTAMRNLIDHRRRSSRRWSDLLLHVWHCRDGVARGIIGSGLIGVGDLSSVLGRRWPLRLQPVPVEELRIATYQIARQLTHSEAARYQHVKFAIWPRRDELPVSSVAGVCVEPMPIILWRLS
jgi:hypothetical protein